MPGRASQEFPARKQLARSLPAGEVTAATGG